MRTGQARRARAIAYRLLYFRALMVSLHRSGRDNPAWRSLPLRYRRDMSWLFWHGEDWWRRRRERMGELDVDERR